MAVTPPGPARYRRWPFGCCSRAATNMGGVLAATISRLLGSQQARSEPGLPSVPRVGPPIPPRTRRPRPTGGAWIFLVPGIITVALFFILPAAYVIYLSVYHSTITQIPVNYVGTRNYSYLFHSPLFFKSLITTCFFALGVTVTVLILGLAVAAQLDKRLRFTTFYRSIIFLPYVFPLVASGIAFTWLLRPQDGLVALLLNAIGITTPNWLASTTTALPVVVLVTVWEYLGFYMLIFLSGLQAIDQGLKESARIDGASERAIFWKITMPLLTPTLFFASVICIIQSFQAFDQIYILTQGGPVNATTTLTYYIFSEAFQFFHFGGAAAASVILMLLLVLLTAVQFRFSRRWVVKNDDQS
jgi:ABC-type sugar transport system permease subunit